MLGSSFTPFGPKESIVFPITAQETQKPDSRKYVQVLMSKYFGKMKKSGTGNHFHLGSPLSKGLIWTCAHETLKVEKLEA